MEDKLSELEEIEYLKQRLRSRGVFIVLFSILSFVLGYAVAQYVHVYIIH